MVKRQLAQGVTTPQFTPGPVGWAHDTPAHPECRRNSGGQKINKIVNEEDLERKAGVWRAKQSCNGLRAEAEEEDFGYVACFLPIIITQAGF